MESINLIVVDNNEGVTSSIKKYFEVRSNINVVKTLKDGAEALNYICENRNEFDVIIMDLLLQKVDGISLLHSIKKHKLDKKIIVLSSYMNETLTPKISSLGVDYYMLKPFSLESLEDRIKDLFKKVNFKSNRNQKLELQVSEILHNLGVPSHIRGYQYIRDGIIFIYNSKNYVTYITKDIYPTLALSYETTPSRVERAIRHAIELSWDRGDLDLMEELFGHSINFQKSKPTNSEYINTIADRLKIDNRMTIN